MIDCRGESPVAKTNASASYISSPQTIPETHSVSLFSVNLVGTLFERNIKPFNSSDFSHGEKIVSSTSPRHIQNQSFPDGTAYNNTTSPMLQLHYIAHPEQTGRPE